MEVVGGDGAERDLRRMGKAAPLDKGGGGEMGEALNSSPKANFKGEQKGLQSMLRPRVVVESGAGGWLGRGGFI